MLMSVECLEFVDLRECCLTEAKYEAFGFHLYILHPGKDKKLDYDPTMTHFMTRSTPQFLNNVSSFWNSTRCVRYHRRISSIAFLFNPDSS